MNVARNRCSLPSLDQKPARRIPPSSPPPPFLAATGRPTEGRRAAE